MRRSHTPRRHRLFDEAHSSKRISRMLLTVGSTGASQGAARFTTATIALPQAEAGVPSASST